MDLNEGVLSLKNIWSFFYLLYFNNDFSWKGYSIICILIVLYYVRRWLKLFYLNLWWLYEKKMEIGKSKILRNVNKYEYCFGFVFFVCFNVLSNVLVW